MSYKKTQKYNSTKSREQYRNEMRNLKEIHISIKEYHTEILVLRNLVNEIKMQ